MTYVAKAQFRARGYTDRDRESLRQALSVDGEARLRPLHMPEAGGAAELWLVVDFVGKAAAEGLIAAATLGAVKALGNSLTDFFNYKRRESEFPADPQRLTLTFDDLDIVVSAGIPSFVEDLTARVEEIREHLGEFAQASRYFDYVYLPLLLRDGLFAAALPWDELPDGFRFWGLGTWDPSPMITAVYDSAKRTIIPIPWDELPQLRF